MPHNRRKRPKPFNHEGNRFFSRRRDTRPDSLFGFWARKRARTDPARLGRGEDLGDGWSTASPETQSVIIKRFATNFPANSPKIGSHFAGDARSLASRRKPFEKKMLRHFLARPSLGSAKRSQIRELLAVVRFRSRCDRSASFARNEAKPSVRPALLAKNASIRFGFGMLWRTR